MLVPKLDQSTGEYTYDSGKYQPIAATGLDINSHCVATTVVGGSGQGLGGYDDVGRFSSTVVLITIHDITDQPN